MSLNTKFSALSASMLFVISAVFFTSSAAYADPLSLSELNDFSTWIQKTEACRDDHPYTDPARPSYVEQRARFECLSRCGVPSHRWEKDGARSDLTHPDSVYPIDRHDLKLAILEFQSRPLGDGDERNDLDEYRNDRGEQVGFGQGFDPRQLICYGDVLARQGEVEDNGSITRAIEEGNIVIPGTLCPYDSEIASSDPESAFYGCPYLSGVDDNEVINRHYPFCSDYACSLEPFNFDRDLIPAQSANGEETPTYWAGTYRPLLCPEVVCDLYNREPAPEDQEGLCYPDDDAPDLPIWLSRRLGDETLCDLSFSGGDACGLNQRCMYQDALGRGVCVDRAECAQADGCPVADLKLMSESDQELIVWVYLLHSSAPVRALDFHLTYPRDQLVLADSRRLPALLYSGGGVGAASGKQLATRHQADGTLRLSVFDPVSSAPIPYGPIIELVFRRVGSGEATVSFTDDAELREMSMAPNQDSARAQLRDDGAWGDPVRVEARDQAAVKLRLWYDFESRESPLGYNTTQTAEELCEEITDCALEPEPARRALYLNRLRKLQRGQAYVEDQLEGISQLGGYLNGSTDHIRLPIMINEELRREAQSFSFSTWFYTEGNSDSEELDTPQVLFAHNNLAERTRFGLWLREDPNASSRDESGARSYHLEFFNGDYLAVDLPTGLEVTHLGSVELRKWYHLAFTFDARAKHLRFYVDGEEIGDYPFGDDEPHPFSCPQFDRGRDVILHTEGEILGGRSPDAIYYASKVSGLYQIWRRNTEGTTNLEVLSSGVANYYEPDYQPELDRLVFVSNASGSDEIWISDGAGAQARQLTVGFGNAELGISARAPRWAPDGSGIVFESNAFDVIAADNIADQVYHLYYIPYNARENTTAIRLPNGSLVEQLNYQDRLLDETIVFFRLTYGDDTRQHRKVRWMEGKDEGEDIRGRILFEHATPLYRERGISSMLIDEVIPLSASSVISVSGLRSGAIDEELSLLDAHRSVRASATGNQEIERLLYKRTFTRYESLSPLTGASLTVEDGEAGHLVSARVEEVLSGEDLTYTHIIAIDYEPRLDDFSENCWDTNRNGAFDPIEDRNKDNFWDKEDCALREISQLYLEYDSGQVEYRGALALKSADSAGYLVGGQVVERAPWNKRVSLSEVNAPGKSMVGLQLISELQDQPLIPTADHNKITVALLAFKPRVGTIDTADWSSVARLRLVQRFAEETLVIRDLNPDPEYCWDLNLNRLPDPVEDRNGDQEFNIEDCGDQVYDPHGRFEVVRQASFSPRGDAILFDAISQARPVLLYSPNLISGEQLQSLSERSLNLKGMSWRSDESYFPCNWVGGYLQPRLKRITASLRGGLDELKLHEGVRDINSIRSEAERGREWLEREDRDGQIDSNAPDCGTSHLDCPPYHLCVESRCVITPCSPQADAGEAGSCVDLGAQCRLRPISVEQEVSLVVEEGAEGPENYDWVCVAECVSDQQCYQQNCMNGPCLFCDENTSACAECREREVSFGNTTETRVEGCPDQRSFYCADGACRTECYSFEDQQSLYLCDPVTEFCDQGRCVLRDWEWEDLSPLTFLGAADARHDLAPSAWSHYTVAIGESYPLEIQAYGVSDLGSPPELLVQVKGGPFYGGDWRTLGRVSVTSKSASEATQRPILLDSTHPYDAVRLSLIKPPYQNASGLATGLGALDEEFCRDDVRRSNITGEAQAQRICERSAQGSKFRLGYRLDVPVYESVKACQGRGHAACPSRGRDDNVYLYGGSPGVKIVEIKSDGASIRQNKTRNRICSYEGTELPVTAEGTPAKLYYGRITEERSPERAHLCERDPTQCVNRATDPNTISYTGDGAVLNCNLSLNDTPNESASIEYANISWLPPSRSQGIVNLDDGDSCVIAVDNLRSAVCYEWIGGGATIDPYIAGRVATLSTLKMSVPRSFGHDRGFEPQPPPAYSASVSISGYAGGSGLVISNGFEGVEVESGQSSVTFRPLFEGWSYAISIIAQPRELGLSCRLVNDQQGLPLTGRVTRELESESFQVICAQSYQVSGCVNYQDQRCADGPETGKSVALTASVTLNGSSWGAEVNAYLDRPFSFSRRLPIGAAYQVSVNANPRGVSCQITQGAQGVVTTSGTPSVIVSCADQPEHLIPVRVTGLSGDESITLYDRVSESRTVLRPNELTSEGVGSLSTPIREGEAYEVILDEVSRRYRCEVSDGEGVMPEGGFPDDQYVNVTCEPITPHLLKVPIIGVPARDSITLKVTVYEGGDDSRAHAPIIATYTPPDLAGSSSDDPEFTVRNSDGDHVELFNGDHYLIELEEVSTGLECEVRNLRDADAERFVYSSADILSPVLINCQDAEAVADLYTISGSVSGLGEGAVLKLTLNNSPAFLRVVGQSGGDPVEFRFDPVIEDSTYEITVGIQPEGYQCQVVSGGSGRVSGADVTDVEVSCGAAGTLELAFNVGRASEGAPLIAKLIAPRRGDEPPRLVGVISDDAEIEDGNARYAVIEPGKGPEAASLSVGTYHLYVFKCDSGSRDRANKPRCINGDQGLYRSVEIRANVSERITFTNDDFSDLMVASLFASHPSDASSEEAPADASMTCIFLPPNTLQFSTGVIGRAREDSIPSSADQDAPVIGRAAYMCTQDSCEIDGGYRTNEVAYIPLTTGYQVSCSVDVNDSNRRDEGDLVYDGSYLLGVNISLTSLGGGQ